MVKRQRWPWWFVAASMTWGLGLPGALRAQQDAQATAPASTPATPQTGQKAEGNKVLATPDASKPQNDRILWTMPNYLTVENASSAPPLTVGEKFKLAARTNFDPFQFIFIGVPALINQASDGEPSYGQGLRGYAKRYATSFADFSINNFMTGAVVPSLLHQDPRYYQLGKGGLFRRAGYALTRVFVTRSDSGSTQFDYSEILGNAVAAGLSNTYHPPPRTLANDVSIWWSQIGWDAAGLELKEFWPDLKRKFHRSSGRPDSN